MLSRALLEQPSKKSCVNLTVLEFDLSFYFSYSISSVGSVFLLISIFSQVGHFQTLYSLIPKYQPLLSSADVVAQTRISYPAKELLQLVHSHLTTQGLLWSVEEH